MSAHRATPLKITHEPDRQADRSTAGPPPAPSSSHDEQISILLVDDEPRNLTVLETVLMDPSYRLVRAESGEQALLALVSEEFALMVLDIQMPGMSGFELAQLIKQRKKTAGVPIIFLTAYYSEDQHVLEGYSTGAVDYLHKPINPTILRSKVAVFAELHRKNRECARSNQSLLNEVTARRRAEEQLRQLNDELERRVVERTQTVLQRERELRSLADNTPDILTRFDRELRYVFVNSAMEKATGRPRDKFLGRPIKDVGMPEDLCVVWEAAIRFVFAAKEPSTIEFGSACSGGARRYATRLVPEFGPSGEAEFVLGVTQDVTDQKWAEEALKNADRRKDEFLATLAHELRNPLAPIRSGLDVLNLSPNPALAVDARNMMDRQVSHMVRLIDDLLDASRITNGKLTLRKECVSLRVIAETAVEASRPVIEAARHTLILTLPEEPIWLDADPTRLAQMVSNLLTNAAKYTPEGGCIEFAADRDGSEVRVCVKDNGLGIPSQMLAEVFAMFTQVNRTLDRAQGGLGIGLALVKRLVELHGGTITAESAGLGQGSTFTVRLPIIEDRAHGAECPTNDETQSAQSPMARRRVLVVDDNVDAAESLAQVLRIRGHETRTAHCGQKALDTARTFKPEVLLLDIGLPGMDGYEVAKRLRREPSLNGVVLIALTGWGDEDNKRQSREAGFDFHLTKPVELSAIESILTPAARDGRKGGQP
jgi:PAS domain S-box-containing protein